VAKRPHHKNTVSRTGTGVNRNSDGLPTKPARCEASKHRHARWALHRPRLAG
jgi:hypothetical protein